jgi:uncharacterized protein
MGAWRLRWVAGLVVVALVVGVGCGSEEDEAAVCPPAERPPGFGQACGADGECDGYLKCIEGTCGWPAAMSGATDDGGICSVRIDSPHATPISFLAEVAASDLARSRGLAERPCIRDDWSMLFAHPDEEELHYTVEQMHFPIDLIFADSQGNVVAVHSDLEPGSAQQYSSGEPARYALEVPVGGLGGHDPPTEMKVIAGVDGAAACSAAEE